jgi:hypothetical protein
MTLQRMNQVQMNSPHLQIRRRRRRRVAALLLSREAGRRRRKRRWRDSNRYRLLSRRTRPH